MVDALFLVQVAWAVLVADIPASESCSIALTRWDAHNSSHSKLTKRSTIQPMVMALSSPSVATGTT
ncbi:hypothetical protein CJ178_31040 [Rhodococcus sp. ACPA4]|nr:hypothetical protein CJ178_31040 [Rhodococcus sp. ACPA4]